MANALSPITRMLRTWRKRRDPRAMPGFTDRYGKRNHKGLTQVDMALLTGVSEGWYRKLENGAQENYSDDFLERVSRILGLNDAERTHLFYFATGHEPAPLKRPDAGNLDPTLTALVHLQPWPAYTFGPDWDIRVFNEHAGRDFPFMHHGINVMIWALTHHEARLQLIDWEEMWAKPMASQLRLAAKAAPDNKRLAEVVREVKERDEIARKILEEDNTAITHPDGDIRPVHLPNRDGVFEVEFVTLARLRNNTKLMVVRPPDITIAGVPTGTPGTPAAP